MARSILSPAGEVSAHSGDGRGRGRIPSTSLSVASRHLPRYGEDLPVQSTSSAGTFPPFSDSFLITCLCSQMFIAALSPLSPL